MEKCVAQTSKKESCNNYPMKTSKYCQRHDPRFKLARKKASALGRKHTAQNRIDKQWDKEHRKSIRGKKPKVHEFEYDSNIASTFIKLIRSEVRQAIMEIFFPKDRP